MKIFGWPVIIKAATISLIGFMCREIYVYDKSAIHTAVAFFIILMSICCARFFERFIDEGYFKKIFNGIGERIASKKKLNQALENIVKNK